MYVANKEKIIVKEHELLRVLSFDVELDLPHKYLLNIARYDWMQHIECAYNYEVKLIFIVNVFKCSIFVGT